MGKIGYCDITPAYLLKMVCEQNWISNILNVEYTINCKLVELLHPLPVNDEIKDNEIKPVPSKMGDQVIACQP